MSHPPTQEPTPPTRSGQLLVLEEARVQYGAVRSTMDAYNVRVGWYFAYLGVLLVAIATALPAIDGIATRIAGTVAIACIAWAAWCLHRVALPGQLHGINHPEWMTSDERAREPEDVTARKLTASLMGAIAVDHGEGGAIQAQGRRLESAVRGALVSTVAVLVTIGLGVWL